MIPLSEIPKICRGVVAQAGQEGTIEFLITDSRKRRPLSKSLFFALPGTRANGHEHIGDLYRRGLKRFVVQQEVDYAAYPGAHFIRVDSSLEALQALVAHRRRQLSTSVVAIAGDKGKTTVKEWLYRCLHPDRSCMKSSGGSGALTHAALSAWRMCEGHEYGIFEADIRHGQQAEDWRDILCPAIGVITHTEQDQLPEWIAKRASLFKSARVVVYPGDDVRVRRNVVRHCGRQSRLIGWGQTDAADVKTQLDALPVVNFSGLFGAFSLTLPFTDKASVENILYVIVVLCRLGYTAEQVQQKLALLNNAEPPRITLEKALDRCILVRDAYSHDVDGLAEGLDFLTMMGSPQKTLILSDPLGSDRLGEQVFSSLVELLKAYPIRQLIGVGEGFCAHRERFAKEAYNAQFYPTAESFVDRLESYAFADQTLFVKGTEALSLNAVVSRLQYYATDAVMEIDLDALTHNLCFFQSLLESHVKTMVMVKAFAYGNGLIEVARLLQYRGVDYLGVAYTDEGVELRRNGITLPIMVMCPTPETFDRLLRYRLEPGVHSVELLSALATHLSGKPCGIHLEIDTGMHRTGVVPSELPLVNSILSGNPNLRLVGLCAHMAASEEERHDRFSTTQARLLQSAADKLEKGRSDPLLHLLNSSGILRFPSFQYDMVRLGIGLHGTGLVDTAHDDLRPVATFRTTVIQVRDLAAGDTVGYGRVGVLTRATKIASLSVGYADGFPRKCGKGKAVVYIRGKKAPVVGQVCMDITMVDVTEIEGVQRGDVAYLFGGPLPIQEVADRMGTIAYEALTSVGQRVKRVFCTRGH